MTDKKKIYTIGGREFCQPAIGEMTLKQADRVESIMEGKVTIDNALEIAIGGKHLVNMLANILVPVEGKWTESQGEEIAEALEEDLTRNEAGEILQNFIEDAGEHLIATQSFLKLMTDMGSEKTPADSPPAAESPSLSPETTPSNTGGS